MEIGSIIDSNAISFQNCLNFKVSLINMAHKCYAGKVKYVDTVLEVTKRLFDNINLDKIEYGTPVGREMEKLLKIPISNYNNGSCTTTFLTFLWHFSFFFFRHM